MIAVSILDNSITHAHTYVIVVLCVFVATHGHLPSNTYILTISKNDTRMICANIIIGNSKKNIIIGKKREIYKIKS